jgi:hypothetical protein
MASDSQLIVSLGVDNRAQEQTQELVSWQHAQPLGPSILRWRLIPQLGMDVRFIDGGHQLSQLPV